MSEYWVSKKKYFCKYCDIYIADDAPSRQHHENGMRHKGNVERFIRGIYKQGEKQKKDLEEEKREMKRVEQAAAAAFAQDVGAGLARPSSSSVASSSSLPPKPAPKPSNIFANYSTAESLGYTDPDAARIAAELEARRTQGLAGEWQIVETSTPAPAPNAEDPSQDATSDNSLKRQAETLADEDNRTFKLRKKTLHAGLGDVYDPGLIPIKVKKQRTEEIPPSQPAKAIEDKPSILMQAADETKTASSSQKWAKPQWSTPLPDLKKADASSMFSTDNFPTEKEDLTSIQLTSNTPLVKEEPDTIPDPPSVAVPVFKKRKAPANAGNGRRGL